MNRSDYVFTAREYAGAEQVLVGPFTLDNVKDWKHKYSVMVHNVGNPNFAETDLYIRAEYWDGSAWQVAQVPGVARAAGVDAGNASMNVVAGAEAMMEFCYPKGTNFRFVGHGIGGMTEGRIVVLETPFESNVADR
jgi:hypothetical protein